jgi:hypothetical protein
MTLLRCRQRIVLAEAGLDGGIPTAAPAGHDLDNTAPCTWPDPAVGSMSERRVAMQAR